MFKRKLFKRALPIILSVAMVFQSMPATAMAAEDPVVVETNAEDSGTSDSADETTADEVQEPADGQQPDTGAPADSQEQSEADAPQGSEAQTETTAPVESEGQTETDAPAEGAAQEVTIVPDAEQNQEEATDEELQGADAAELKTEIKIQNLTSVGGGLTLSSSENGTYAFSGTYGNADFSNVKSNVKSKVTVEVDGVANDALKDDVYLKLQFQQEKDGNYEDMVGLPEDAGKYRLKISVDAVPELCGKAEDKFVGFEITKAELKLNLTGLTEAKPGASISEFKKNISENYTLSDSSKKSLTTLDTADIKVYQFVDGKRAESETTDTEFNKENTYVMTVGVKFKDEAATGANYTIVAADYYVIDLEELVQPTVSVSLKKPVDVKTYDEAGAGLDLTAIINEYVDTVQVTKKENNAEVSITAETTPAWYTREITTGINMPELDEKTQFDDTKNGYRYTVFDGNPKDAGDYYIVYKYEGEAGKYKEAYSNAVQVSIDPASLALVPTDDAKLKVGMNPSAVGKFLAEVQYDLYRTNVADDNVTKGELYKAYKDIDKTFFGVSYGEATYATQYYVPEFELEYCEELDKDQQTETDKFGAWKKYDWEMKITKGTADKAVKYRIVPTGYKVVYSENGEADNWRPIDDITTNSAEKNYRVDMYEPLEIVPEDVTPTEIKLDAIVNAFKSKGGQGGSGTDVDDMLWMVWDDELLFETRAEYKQAEVTGANVKNEDPSITYTWEVADTSAYNAYIAADPAEDDGKVQQAAKKYLLDSFETRPTWTDNSSFISPSDAALYRLHIAYRDADNNFESSDAYVYFQIKPRAIITVPNKQYASYGNAINKSSVSGGYSIYALDKDGNAANWEETAMLLPLDSEQLEKANAQLVVTRKTPAGWETATESTFMEGEEYQAAYTIEDNWGDTGLVLTITTTEGDEQTVVRKVVKWQNLTNKWYNSEKKAWEYYTVASDIIFNSKDIALTVSEDAASSKVYDAEPAFTTLPEGFLTVNDAITGAPAGLEINTDATEKPGAVNLYWKWSANGKPLDVAFDEVVYGGTYTLYANFEGNDSYKAIVNQPVMKADGKPYTFEVTKRDISIAPVLKTDMAAGQRVYELWNQQEITYNNVPAADEWAFQYKSSSAKYVWNADNKITAVPYTGYAVLNGKETDAETHARNCIFNDITIKDGTSYDVYLRTNREYTAQFTNYNNDLAFPYSVSYNTTWDITKSEKIAKRGTVTISSADFLTLNSDKDGVTSVNVYSTVGENGYTVVPREGIPFAYETVYSTLRDADGEQLPMDKNYIAFRISVPREFLGNSDNDKLGENVKRFVYENSIQNANGYVFTKPDSSTDYIEVLFPVALDSAGKAGVPDKDGVVNSNKAEFDITWEEGYTDHFTLNLENAKLESNLRDAVAPKSIAFNGVQSKMAVGETQQLDVKIKKAQLGDIVRINYKLADGSPEGIISIDPDTGLVTACQPSKTAVTVEAYPVRLAEDGKTFVRVKDKNNKDAKGATTKITVTEVTAPAIKTVESVDNAQVRVSYTVPDNGYRREIYVVEAKDKAEAKTWTKDKFDTEIDNMVNGQWEDTAFAIAPVYMTDEKYFTESNDYDVSEEYYYDTAKKLFNVRLYDLPTAGGTYVVYVRNVSAERTLADGSTVAFSKAGTVKSVVTTLAKVQDLEPKFTVTATENDKKNPVKYYDIDQDGYITTSTEMVYYTTNRDNNIKVPDNKIPVYVVDLFAKSAQVSVDGWFKEKPSNAAADSHDYISRELPLKKTEKDLLKSYVEPKVTYAVTDSLTGAGVPKLNAKTKKWEYTASKFAAISNSGKISFKGVDRNGIANVYVWALADNGVSNYCLLKIIAMPDSFTGKKAKMKVGDQLRLATLLDYKQGKTKVPSYRSTGIEITSTAQEIEAAGFELTQAKGGEWINGESCVAGEWIITAKAPTPATIRNLSLKVKDWSLVEDPTKVPETTVTLTAAQLDAVKGLKAVYVDNKNITLNFTHAGHPEAFDIEVKDARGSVIYKKLVKQTRTVYATDPEYKQRQQKGIIRYEWDGESGVYTGGLTYFAKTKTYAITINTDRLVRLSAYTISVTPVYEGQYAAKAATAKAKTTNIPASYCDVDATKNGRGGVYIVHREDAGYGNTLTSSTRYFTSGNTYTLSLYGKDFNANAKDRVTDTLTWKSSNTKVASIKANAGSYTATMKAVQQGTTTISVTSKITKKVIARWDVQVKAVGNGKGFGGDYEWTSDDTFYRDILAKWDPFYEGKLEVLTLSNSFNVPSGERIWASFTAPSYGEYTFGGSYTVYGSKGMEQGSSADRTSYKLEAGQTIYFWVTGGTLEVTNYTDFTRLTVKNDSEANALTVPASTKGYSWIAFTAPEDNVYTFVGASGYTKDNTDVNGQNPTISMKLGETIFLKAYAGRKLYVTYRNAGDNVLAADGTPLSVSLTEKETTKYVKFTAPTSQDYTFEVTGDGINITYYEAASTDALTPDKYVVTANALAAGEADATAPATQERTLYLEGGTAIILKLEGTVPAGKTIDATVKVTSAAAKELATEETVTKDTIATLSYKIPEASNAQYQFTAANASLSYYSAKGDELYLYGTLTIKDGKATNNSNIKTGDTIYIKVDASGAAEDAKVSVTAVSCEALTDSASPTLKDGLEEWYTFEAKTEGWYEFSAKAVKNADPNPTHTVAVESYSDIFDGYYDYRISLSSSGESDSKLVQLDAGQKVILKASSDDYLGDDVSTTATISVNKVTVTPISMGETSVSLSAKDSVNYYSFTAERKDDYLYTFAWTPAENTGDAETKYGSSLNSMNQSVSPPHSDYVYAGIRYISVRQTTDTAVAGTLKISTESSENKVLASGANSFDVKANETVTYKFTVPKNNKLGYKLTVANTTTVGEGEIADVCVDGYYVAAGEITCITETEWTTAGTEKFNVGNNGSKAVTGTITVEPITAVDFPADGNAKVTNAAPAWYQYTVTEAGRYLFVKEDNETTTNFYKNGLSINNIVRDTAYLKSGDTIYAYVSTTSKDEKTAVVKAPEKIVPTALALDTEVTVEKDVDYYEFEAPAYAEYTFAEAYSVRYAVPKGSNDSDCESVLKAGEKVFITAYKDAKLKVTKNDITKLVLGVESDDVTLEAGKTATFAYNIFENGIYAVKATTNKVTISGYGNVVNETAYKAGDMSSGSKTLTVTNNTEENVTFKVSVSKVEPTELTAGADAVKVTKNESNPDAYEWFSFKADESYKYVFEKGTDKEIAVAGEVSSWADEQYIAKYSEKNPDSEVVFAVSAAEESNIKVSKLQPKTNLAVSDTATEVNVVAADVNSKWMTFTALKTGEYSFTFESETVSSSSIKKYDNLVNSGVYSADVSYKLEKDNSIYFKVDTSVDAKVNVKVELSKEVAEFKAGANVFDATENVTEAYFTASEAGVYSLQLTLDGESGNFVSVRTELTGDTTGKLDSELTYALAAGESVYFSPTSGDKGTITISKTADMRVLKNGIGVGVPAGKTWYVFTAEEDSYYRISNGKGYTLDVYMNSNVSGNPDGYTDFYREEGSSVYICVEASKPGNIQITSLE